MQEQHTRRSRQLTKAGFLASAAYLIAMGVWALLERPELVAMSPNEFGDLLAGIFSPLAFLWLVLGFLQQGQELRASVEALRLQGEELRASVEQQRQLVEATREQLKFDSEMLAAQREELDRTSQPIFDLQCNGSVGSGGDGSRSYTFLLANTGRPATDVRVIKQPNDLLLRRELVLATGAVLDFKMNMPTTDKTRRDITVHYVDAQGRARNRQYVISAQGGMVDCQPKNT